MIEIERILDQFRRAYNGDAWYGPSLQEVLAGVTGTRALARPIGQVHCIWEILLHMTAWENAVRVRLQEGRVGVPDEGDWPAIEDTSEAAWRGALDAFARCHSELDGLISGLTDARLDHWLGAERSRETGGGVSVYVTLHGIIQHDVYHAAQIALLKKSQPPPK
jgi:uncharacterized damage-inducible protein DinB